MYTTQISSAQDFYRCKRQLKTEISTLQAKPQQFNALATRLRNNEPGASDEISSLVDQTKEQIKSVNAKFKSFSDPSTDLFATNREQKKTEVKNFKNDIQNVLESIQNAEKHLVNSEKQAINDYNTSRQLVNFDDDDLSSSNNPFGPPPTYNDSSKSQQQNSSFSNTNYTRAQKTKQANLETDKNMERRQKDIAKIERDIVNVGMIYKELNTLVYQQGEHIDNIENHIDIADAEVEEGVNQLSAAATHAVSARKKKICLTMFCIAATVTIVIIMWISWKFN